MSRIWQVSSGLTRPITHHTDLESLLFQKRNLDARATEAFFRPVYDRDIHDPLLVHDMDRAVQRVYKARRDGERVLVYGDYDADGISSTAIMMDVLHAIGVHAAPYLPHREDDGYGLNMDVLKRGIDAFDVLLAVDCGVSNIDEIGWVQSRGKDVIIADHHEIPHGEGGEYALPPAHAILHPRHPNGSYPWPHLCGAGVCWKFAQALLRHSESPYADNPDTEKWLLDLAMLGTVGDVMPLLGENRMIVQFGMQVLRRTRRPGLSALMAQAGISRGEDMCTEDISYRVVPYINAAGRMDHPQSALDVLLASNVDQAAKSVKKLAKLNTLRQSVTRSVLREVEGDIDHDSPCVFVSNMEWPIGLVGLIAGRLASKFDKPAVVVGGNGDCAVGSARSPEGVNILDALQYAKEHTVRLGGHASAAGFSVLPNRVEEMKQTVMEYFSSMPSREKEESAVADAVVSHNLLSWDTVDLLDKFEPFGEANPKPLFVIQNLPVVRTFFVGKEKTHIKLRFALEGSDLDGIGFDLADTCKDIGDRVDVLGALEVNMFRGNAALQVRLHDIARAGSVDIRFA